jgi:hypothetical protein
MLSPSTTAPLQGPHLAQEGIELLATLKNIQPLHFLALLCPVRCYLAESCFLVHSFRFGLGGLLLLGAV